MAFINSSKGSVSMKLPSVVSVIDDLLSSGPYFGTVIRVDRVGCGSKVNGI
jgi:hypothetical protein